MNRLLPSAIGMIALLFAACSSGPAEEKVATPVVHGENPADYPQLDDNLKHDT